MQSLIEVLKDIYTPFLIVGIPGYILMAFFLKKQARSILIKVLFCIAIMFLWRMKLKTYTSSRYSENLFAFFTVGAAFFLCYWHLPFKKKRNGMLFCSNQDINKEAHATVYRSKCDRCKKNLFRLVAKNGVMNPLSNAIILCLRSFLICFCILCLIVKYYRYNPFCNYNLKITECIQKDIPSSECAIISMKAHYSYKVNGVSHFTVPEFLHSNEKEFLLNTIRHYQLNYKTLYIVSDYPLKNYILPPDDYARISQICVLKKNAHGKKLHVFKYLSPTLNATLLIASIPFSSGKQNNLFRNGGFEKQYPHNVKQSYYKKIQDSSKNGIIPETKSFPMSWDIFWAFGETDKETPHIYSTDNNVISGQYSLHVKNKRIVSFLYESPFPKGDYLFQCDLRTVSRSTFGLQISLRDEKGVFYGFREIKRIYLGNSNQLYHYEFQLTEDMIYPFQSFYLYFVSYDQGDFLIDNICLTKQSH